jgi:hypothetical protein
MVALILAYPNIASRSNPDSYSAQTTEERLLDIAPQTDDGGLANEAVDPAIGFLEELAKQNR